jgi:hypothetical protein
MERPLGVTLIALLLALNGVVVLIQAIAMLFMPPVSIGSFLFGLVLGAILLYLAYSFYNHHEWAWVATLIIEGLNAIVGIVSILAFPSAIGSWISLILAIVIIAYLLTPSVRHVFHVGSAR